MLARPPLSAEVFLADVIGAEKPLRRGRFAEGSEAAGNAIFPSAEPGGFPRVPRFG